MTDKELMQQALYALEYASDMTKPENMSGCGCPICVTITALRDRLAQPEQEPVAWRWKERINNDFDSWVISASEPPPYSIEQQPLYSTPPQRKPLTDEKIWELTANCLDSVLGRMQFARMIEAEHGIKENNT